MENKFLENYIRLEKLCSDIYRENHGISKYIEDMENARGGSRIPDWDETYKRLKELRWKRNLYVHEGDIRYDDDDIDWLDDFYWQIVGREDPMSLLWKLKKQAKATRESQSENKAKGNCLGRILLALLVFGMVTTAVIIGIIFLVNRM